MYFLYVKVPLQGEFAFRQDRLHEAVDAALTGQGAGALVSWGSSLDELGERGHRAPKYHRLDLEASDPTVAREALRGVLSGLDVPLGTEIHFTLDGSAQQEVLGASGWSPPRPNPALPRART
jgi:hypothetical protein